MMFQVVYSAICRLEDTKLKRLHMHHMGVDRTLFVTRTVDTDVNRESVWRVVGNCTLDPAPRAYETRTIQVEEDWKRLTIYVTLYQRKVYFSMVT